MFSILYNKLLNVDNVILCSLMLKVIWTNWWERQATIAINLNLNKVEFLKKKHLWVPIYSSVASSLKTGGFRRRVLCSWRIFWVKFLKFHQCSCNRFQTLSSLTMMSKISNLSKTLEDYKLTGLDYVNWTKNLFIGWLSKKTSTFNQFKMNFITVMTHIRFLIFVILVQNKLWHSKALISGFRILWSKIRQ